MVQREFMERDPQLTFVDTDVRLINNQNMRAELTNAKAPRTCDPHEAELSMVVKLFSEMVFGQLA